MVSTQDLVPPFVCTKNTVVKPPAQLYSSGAFLATENMQLLGQAQDGYHEGMDTAWELWSLQISWRLVSWKLMDLWVWFLFISQKAFGHSPVLSSDLH